MSTGDTVRSPDRTISWETYRLDLRTVIRNAGISVRPRSERTAELDGDLLVITIKSER